MALVAAVLCATLESDAIAQVTHREVRILSSALALVSAWAAPARVQCAAVSAGSFVLGLAGGIVQQLSLAGAPGPRATLAAEVAAVDVVRFVGML